MCNSVIFSYNIIGSISSSYKMIMLFCGYYGRLGINAPVTTDAWEFRLFRKSISQSLNFADSFVKFYTFNL
jgi:hypothetical protein